MEGGEDERGGNEEDGEEWKKLKNERYPALFALAFTGVAADEEEDDEEEAEAASSLGFGVEEWSDEVESAAAPAGSSGCC